LFQAVLNFPQLQDIVGHWPWSLVSGLTPNHQQAFLRPDNPVPKHGDLLWCPDAH